jgi:hypothetical protein
MRKAHTPRGTASTSSRHNISNHHFSSAISDPALTSLARVKIACGEWRSAEDDLHEALVIALKGDGLLCIPDALECLAQLACAADSHHEAARLLGGEHTLRQRMGAVRLVVFDAGYDAGPFSSAASRNTNVYRRRPIVAAAVHRRLTL